MTYGVHNLLRNPAPVLARRPTPERHPAPSTYVPIGARESIRVLPRPAESTDLAYVMRTWELSWRMAARCRRLSGRDYRDLFRRMVRAGLMAQDDTRITIGCDETSPTRIWSWVCWTPGRTPTLHYAYTRAEVDGVPLRQCGMFRTLLGAIGVRDALIYTMEPGAQRGPSDRRTSNLPELLQTAADRAGIATLHRPIGEWLDLRSGT